MDSTPGAAEVRAGENKPTRHSPRRFARFIAARVNSGESIEMGIGHAICPDDASILAAEFRQTLATLDALKICDLGTGIGVHGGPGTLLVSTRPAVSANDFAVDVD